MNGGLNPKLMYGVLLEVTTHLIPAKSRGVAFMAWE